MQIQEEDEWLKEEAADDSHSLFYKKVVAFTNQDIENNIDQRMKTPIYNIELHQLEENAEEDSIQQEKQLFSSKGMCQGKANPNTDKTEALFNPLQDEQNELWIKKHFKKAGRALCCPCCFNQLAFNYQIADQNQDDIVYSTLEIFSAEVKQNAIVRQQNVSEKMAWVGAQSQQAESLLKQREEEFNVKIIVECSCGNVIGYYDINKDCYMLTNVV